MGGGVQLALLGVVLVVVGWFLGRQVSEHVSAREPDPEDPELAEAFRRIEAELGIGPIRPTLLPLVRRGTPLRTIRPAPSRHATRLGFADGTVVLVRSSEDHLASLALAMSRGAVVPVDCEGVDGELVLTLRTWRGPLKTVVVGLDQAD